MQDVRIRVAAASVLSIAAFASIPGAVAAFMWWLIFTPRVSLIRKAVRLVPIFALIAFFSIVLEVTSGGGISYFLRILVIVLIGLWMYTEYRPGEFLSLCVWLAGNERGFELGMIAEMSIQGLETIRTDIDHIRLAQRLKCIRWGVHTLVPTGVIVVQSSIARAEDSAELMAIRGYSGGGTMCPRFKTGGLDIIAGIAVIFVLIAGFVPVSEFFILYR